jgi:hypothetical protein
MWRASLKPYYVTRGNLNDIKRYCLWLTLCAHISNYGVHMKIRAWQNLEPRHWLTGLWCRKHSIMMIWNWKPTQGPILPESTTLEESRKVGNKNRHVWYSKRIGNDCRSENCQKSLL